MFEAVAAGYTNGAATAAAAAAATAPACRGRFLWRRRFLRRIGAWGAPKIYTVGTSTTKGTSLGQSSFMTIASEGSNVVRMGNPVGERPGSRDDPAVNSRSC